MILKNTNTKYQVLELIASNKEGTRFKMLGVITKKQANIQYGEAEVLSVKDYADTCTTSVIIEDKPEYKGFVISW